MHPILAQLGPIPIHTYGFLIATGFIIAVQISDPAKLPSPKFNRFILYALMRVMLEFSSDNQVKSVLYGSRDRGHSNTIKKAESIRLWLEHGCC